jgi:3D (Asp-Asp-Asp) domain-containing protein
MKIRIFKIKICFVLLISCFVLFLSGCASIRPPRGVPARTVTIETTSYCDCGSCCGWERVWWAPWRTVYSSGPNEGKPKKVGITASGTKAHKGTIAADRRYYPFGTIMYVPGYGYGRVEDTGSAIQGPTRIDLFYNSHRQALDWGRQRVPVKVWR